MPVSAIAMENPIEQKDTEIVGGSVTLNFDSKCGTECESMVLPVASTPTTYELPTPMKAGHTFLGWFTDDGTEIKGENVFSAFANVVNGESATVKAHWEKQEPATMTSSVYSEDIEDSEYYYDIVQTVENFADGSKIVIDIKTKKIEGFITEEQTTTTYYNQDGSTTMESMVLLKGDDEYQRAKAKNDLMITVVDTEGNPVEGFEVNFKTNEEDINLKTDKDGKIIRYFKGSYETKVISIPDGYASNKPVEKLGLGKMYSVSYFENYVLDIVDIGEPPIKDKEDADNGEPPVKEENKTEIEEPSVPQAPPTGEDKEEIPADNNPTENKPEEDADKDKEENPSQSTTDKKEDTTIVVPTENPQKPSVPENKNTDNVSENNSNNTVETKQNKDVENKEEIKSPQTGDDSFSFLWMFPKSIIGMFLFRKKVKK